MKNKKVIYLLGFAVFVVWGMIIYKLINVNGNNDDNMHLISGPFIKEPYNDYEVKKDTYSLNLKYRDPFGLVKFKDTINNNIKIAHRVLPKSSLAPSISWDFIKYDGYIRNPVTKKLLAIVMINGKNADMAEGETTDKVKLLKNMRDSIKVSFNGKFKFIPLHNGAI